MDSDLNSIFSSGQVTQLDVLGVSVLENVVLQCQVSCRIAIACNRMLNALVHPTQERIFERRGVPLRGGLRWQIQPGVGIGPRGIYASDYAHVSV